VKARRVKGLKPDLRLDDAAARIVAVRLGELTKLAGKAQTPEAVEELHDTRIAAKRLRYVLEITAPCFGPYAATAIKKVKDLQDLLGEIHDCDEMLPRLAELRGRLRDRDAAHLVGHGLEGEPPNANAYRGLERLTVELTARRAKLFADWLEAWRDLARLGFVARLQFALAEREQDVNTPA
jgi:CHAD domain-containing protein